MQSHFESERTWTGEQLHDKVLNVAKALVDKYNIKNQDTVCIAYDNTDMTYILALGLICAGAIVACSYPKDPYNELLYLARKVGPKFLFCHAKNVEKWSLQLSSDLGYEVHAISMDTGGDLRHDNLDSLMNYDHRKSTAQLACYMRRDMQKQVALITMSSGTTGKPKAVPVTHWNCVAELVSAYKERGPAHYRGLSFACCSSLDYVSGRLIAFGAINSGYNAVIMNGFEPEPFAEAVEKFKINLLYLGAASFYNLITHPNIDKYDLSSLKMIFPMGAKVIYLKELNEFLQKYPNIRSVRQGFGASELGGAAMNSLTPQEYMHNSTNCGRLLPGVSAKIIDPINGINPLGINQEGIIRLKGPTIFPGYYDVALRKNRAADNGDANDEELPLIKDLSVFDEDGFYISGDLGYFNEKEELIFMGRQKELLSCRGAKKVLPQELEEILDKHPAVDKVCVLGIPDKKNQLLHCPRAFVKPKNEYLDNPESIDQLKAIRPKIDTLNEELDSEMQQMSQQQELLYTGDSESKLCSLPKEWRRKLSVDIMEFMNERIGWEKQLTGGIVLLDEIPTSRATGKFDKNYLRSLTLELVEIYGDQSG